MNKRIAELAENAGYPNCMTYGQDLVLERFAELIVQECVEVCYKGDSTQATCNGAANMIKQHFGIK